MKAIVSLTVPEGKRLIASAVARMPEVRRAWESGQILLKGGTTVSAVAEELVGVPMRISGRITPQGLRTARTMSDAPHSMLIQDGQWQNVDQRLSEVAERLGPEDVIISSANIIDAYGGAALMAGASMGGGIGPSLSGFMTEGASLIIAVGLEKLIPGTVAEAIRAAGRKGVDRSTGMAVGLMPIFGRIVTEVDAVKLLAPVECQVIGRGGIQGAEGGVTLALAGQDPDVERLLRLVLELKGAVTSGVPQSLEPCEGPHARCKLHKGCIYRSPKMLEWVKRR